MKSHGIWQAKAKDWGVRLAIVLLATCWLMIVAASWANAAPSNAKDEYSFNWLDPDKKIYVLQNRRYLKTNRLLLSGMVGTGFSNAYRTTFSIDPRLAFYFSEALGVEVFYTAMTNSENSVYTALGAAARNTLPVVRELRSQYGGLVHWVPWYAKINVFNKILYFDWYFSGGAGMIRSALDTRKDISSAPTYLNEDLFSLFLGTGHQYHLNQNFTVRLDFSGAYYRAPIFGTGGDTTWFSNYVFGMGLGYRL